MRTSQSLNAGVVSYQKDLVMDTTLSIQLVSICTKLSRYLQKVLLELLVL